jgi:hypothetical protein
MHGHIEIFMYNMECKRELCGACRNKKGINVRCDIEQLDFCVRCSIPSLISVIS